MVSCYVLVRLSKTPAQNLPQTLTADQALRWEQYLPLPMLTEIIMKEV